MELAERPKATPTQHAPLVSALKTFYNLLADLGSIERSDIISPPDSGSYPLERFDVAAASEAGFGDEALQVLRVIPYLAESASDCLLDYETVSLNYLDGNSDFAFDFARDPTYQERMDLMPEYVVVLTRGRTGGTELVYNARTSQITAWNHFNDEEEWTAQPSFTMDDVQNPLYQWIIDFLQLRRFPLDGMSLVQVRSEDEYMDAFNFPHPNMRASERKLWETQLHGYRYEATLAKVFIAAGWNVDVVTNLLNEASIPMWDRLEKARVAANAGFCLEDFNGRKEEWERANPYQD